MRFKENKSLIFFLMICLSVTWVMEGVAYHIASVPETNAVAAFLLKLACCMPAIVAILVCIMTRENVLALKIFPKFQGNARIYFYTVIGGLALTCISDTITELFYPKVIDMRADATIEKILFMLMLGVVLACLQCILLMGEEIGWMGFLFPRLEQIWGTSPALIITGVIRGIWHIVLLAQNEKVAVNFLLLCVSNIFCGSILVLLTRKSGSVVPAALFHGLTNGIPGILAGFYVMDEVLYQENAMGIQIVTMIPMVVIGGLCWLRMEKKQIA